MIHDCPRTGEIHENSCNMKQHHTPLMTEAKREVSGCDTSCSRYGEKQIPKNNTPKAMPTAAKQEPVPAPEPKPSEEESKPNEIIDQTTPEQIRIGARVKVLREAKGWTYKELAEAIAEPDWYISAIESGSEELSERTLRDLAKALEITVVELRDSADQSPPSEAAKPSPKPDKEPKTTARSRSVRKREKAQGKAPARPKRTKPKGTPDPELVRIGARIRKLLQIREMSQSDLAKQANLSLSSVNNTIRGLTSPYAKTQAAISKALGTSWEEIESGSGLDKTELAEIPAGAVAVDFTGYGELREWAEKQAKREGLTLPVWLRHMAGHVRIDLQIKGIKE